MPKITIFNFLGIDHKNSKNWLFHIFAVFWDFLCLCPSLRGQTDLEDAEKSSLQNCLFKCLWKWLLVCDRPSTKGGGSMVFNHPWASILAITSSSHAIPNQFIQILKALQILHFLLYYSKRKKLGRCFSRDRNRWKKRKNHRKSCKIIEVTFVSDDLRSCRKWITK